MDREESLAAALMEPFVAGDTMATTEDSEDPDIKARPGQLGDRD